MKIGSLKLIACLAALLILFFNNSYAAEAVDGIVAVVNDQIITQDQLDERMNLAQQELAAAHTAVPSTAALREQVLQHMIDEELQLQLAKKLDIDPTDLDIKQAIDEIAQRNGMSTAQLQAKIQTSGVNYEQYLKRIRDQMIISQLQQREVVARILVSDQEINDVLGAISKQAGSKGLPQHQTVQTHVRHILIKVTPMASDTLVKKQLEQLRTQILQGGDFASLAKANSADPGSANKGGDLGWVVPGMLDPTFEAQMNKLKLDQISEPFKTQFGWHIVQVLERKTLQDSETFLREKARQFVYQRKYQEAMTNWLQQLRSAAYIKIN